MNNRSNIESRLTYADVTRSDMTFSGGIMKTKAEPEEVTAAN